jgi:hypothetical protein
MADERVLRVIDGGNILFVERQVIRICRYSPSVDAKDLEHHLAGRPAKCSPVSHAVKIIPS